MLETAVISQDDAAEVRVTQMQYLGMNTDSTQQKQEQASAQNPGQHVVPAENPVERFLPDLFRLPITRVDPNDEISIEIYYIETLQYYDGGDSSPMVLDDDSNYHYFYDLDWRSISPSPSQIQSVVVGEDQSCTKVCDEHAAHSPHHHQHELLYFCDSMDNHVGDGEVFLSKKSLAEKILPFSLQEEQLEPCFSLQSSVSPVHFSEEGKRIFLPL